MDPEGMKKRTESLALRVMRIARGLPRTVVASVIAKQLVRCGTSVGANYRSACLARSRADFVSKLGIVAEEADETGYWLELLVDSDLCRREDIADVMQEAGELASIVIASIKTARDGRAHTSSNTKSQILNTKSGTAND